MAIQKEHWLLLFAICASMFSTPLMMAGINAVLPELGLAFHAGATQLSLIGALYSLGLAIFQMTCGSLGDIWGHRRIFMLGGCIFAGASLLGGFATHIYPFLALRFFQGMGGAMLSAAGLALLAAAAPDSQRASYLGLSGAAVYAGIACGPPAAGFLTAAFGWECLFYINAATNLLALAAMRATRGVEWRPARGERLDLPGFALYAASICSLTAFSALLGSWPGPGLMLCALFIILIGVFIYREHKAPFPLLHIRLLRQNLPLALSCLAALINYASFFGIIFFFSFYLQTAKGFSVAQAGLILAFQPFMQALATPVATRMTNSFGASATSAAGAAICGVGLLACAFLAPQTPVYALFIAQAFLGAGMASFSLANTAFILDCAGRPHIGQASALTGAARTAGQLGSMIMVTCILSVFLGNQTVSMRTLGEFMTSMRIALVLFGALSLAGVATVLLRNSRKTPANEKA